MGWKSSSTLTPRLAHFWPLYSSGISLRPWGRSRTWPMLASTTNEGPRNFEIVRALAGDSTITSDFPFPAAFLAIIPVRPSWFPVAAENIPSQIAAAARQSVFGIEFTSIGPTIWDVRDFGLAVCEPLIPGNSGCQAVFVASPL